METKTSIFELEPVYPETVNKIIQGLKNNSSCGLDNIPTRILKLGRTELVPAITHMINLSITQKKFPSAWKKAKVIPLHKKDEETNPKNYRPVSLLSNISKILEKSVYLQLYGYSEEEKILNNAHHGFRKSHNTTTAHIQMQDRWLEAFDEGEITAVMMLDMSAAFDLVNHELLCKKLSI